MIVQELHHIQDQFGYLPDDQLRELSQRRNIPLHRIHEVASFFPHFRLKHAPPAADVKVCRDMACHLHGGPALCRGLEAMAQEVGADQMQVGGVSCLGQCDGAPAFSINDHVYWRKSAKEIKSLVRTALGGEPLPRQHADRQPLGWKIDPYNGEPRYEAVRAIVADWNADADSDLLAKRKRVGEALLKKIETAKLRGMGGAGFATHRKWATVRDAPGDVKYVVCNGDESEPGTFKDRELLRRTPHLLVEGMVLAGIVTGAERGYIYIRHEYEEEIEVMREAICDAEAQQVCGASIFGSTLSFPLEVFVSPGGYICGEETALLEAMEDRRAEPRNKPPFPVFEGLYNKPTVINNVETLSWVPSIAIHGGEWYLSQGTNGATGLRFVSISGDVNRPGVYEVPLGQTVRELVFDLAGGVSGDQRLKAIAVSGPSGGFLPVTLEVATLPPVFVEGLIRRKKLAKDATTVDILDVPLDFDVFTPFPDFMLGAAFVVYGDRANMVENALNCVEFYRNESCGKCVPCRLGTQKLVDMIGEIMSGRFQQDLGLVKELSDAMFATSICGLGQVASNPLRTVMKYFRPELERYLSRCTASPSSKGLRDTRKATP